MKPKSKNTKVHSSYNKNYLFRYKHGFDRDEALTVLREQGGCKICGIALEEEGRSWYLDHDHNCCVKNTSCEKCRRGILCRNCNLMLGFAKDNIETLEKSIEYLKAYNNKEKMNGNV
jgi:hypothetical protein